MSVQEFGLLTLEKSSRRHEILLYLYVYIPKKWYYSVLSGKNYSPWKTKES